MECKSYPNDISAGFHYLAFVILLLKRFVEMMMQSA